MLMGRRDYKQGEAIVVAYLAEEDSFIDAFHAGEDMHCHNYSWISGEDYHQIRDGYLDGNPEYKVKRNLGKKAAHAFNYRMGKRRFKDELSKAGIFFEERQCGVILQALENARPKVVQWWHRVETQLKRNRTMTNCFGRRRFFMGIISDDVIREAIAFEPQSTIGDLLNFSIIEMWRTLKDEVDLLLQIHDAIVWQSDKERVQAHAKRIGECMAIPLTINGRTFTIPTDFAWGPSWGELKED
jgi:DNA polymerase I-like protein with 3'-5' exonuclease and polymerase domains